MLDINKSDRIEYIDGIRGAASLSVVTFHFFWESLGGYIPGLRSHYTALFLNGTVAVMIFFILSGDSLSISFFKDRDEKKLAPILLKRYFRLTFIILLTALIVYLTMKLGLTFNKQAGAILNSKEWLGSFLNFTPNINTVFSYSLSNVYIRQGDNYNPFFWTMSVELIGSYFLLLYLFCYNHIKNANLICFGIYIFLAIIGSYISLFFVGMLLCSLRRDGFLKTLEQRIGTLLNLSLLAILFIISSIVFIKYYLQGHSELEDLYFVICPAMLLLVYSNKPLKNILSMRFFNFLGKISYPLYAIHFVVLTTVFSGIISTYPLSKFQIMMLAVCCIVLAIILAIFIEMWEYLYLKRLSEVIKKLIK
ncbi:MAG: acyltransferase family protein [Ewingella sp.]|uniref:acyltransferase family protein n=1 Tax=Ewingella TaxID=41201 RepID=UPI0033653909